MTYCGGNHLPSPHSCSRTNNYQAKNDANQKANETSTYAVLSMPHSSWLRSLLLNASIGESLVRTSIAMPTPHPSLHRMYACFAPYLACVLAYIARRSLCCAVFNSDYSRALLCSTTPSTTTTIPCTTGDAAVVGVSTSARVGEVFVPVLRRRWLARRSRSQNVNPIKNVSGEHHV